MGRYCDMKICSRLHFDNVAILLKSFFLLQVYRHCPTDLRDSDSFKAYITCAVFSGDGQEVKILPSLCSLFCSFTLAV